MKTLQLTVLLLLTAFVLSTQAQKDSVLKKPIVLKIQLEPDIFGGIRLKNTLNVLPIFKPKLTISSDWNKSIRPVEWYYNPWKHRTYNGLASSIAESLGTFLVQSLR